MVDITTGPDGIPTVSVSPGGNSQSSPQSTPTPPVNVAPQTTPTPAPSAAPSNSNTISSGGSTGVGSATTSLVQQAAASLTQPANPAASEDMRVRLAPLYPADVIQAGGLLAPLITTNNSMIFPYTPTINFTQAVNYMDLQLVHSNTDYAAYTRTPSVTISISGKFTVQNQAEGVYALACLHFLRTVSKMYFGENDQQAGLPPPVLVFSGYGNYMFGTGGTQGLRVVLKNHNWSFDDSVDSVSISVPATPSMQPAEGGIPMALQQGVVNPSNGGAGTARLPALFTLSCELMVIQTPQRMRKEFSFAKFASGALMQSGNTGWI